MAKFKAGDTVTNGRIYFVIGRVTKTAYELKGLSTYLPINLVDRVWSLADDENTIEE